MEKQYFLFERKLNDNIKLGLTKQVNSTYKQGIKIGNNDNDIHTLDKCFQSKDSLMYVFKNDKSIINLNFYTYGDKYCYSVSSQDFKNYFYKCDKNPRELTKFYRSIDLPESKDIDKINNLNTK